MESRQQAPRCPLFWSRDTGCLKATLFVVYLYKINQMWILRKTRYTLQNTMGINNKSVLNHYIGKKYRNASKDMLVASAHSSLWVIVHSGGRHSSLTIQMTSTWGTTSKIGGKKIDSCFVFIVTAEVLRFEFVTHLVARCCMLVHESSPPTRVDNII